MVTITDRTSGGARCIALVGPYQSGKTTLLEALLYRTGAIPRQGKVSTKSTIGDASPESRSHAMSVELNVAAAQFLGETYTFIDCPGSIEFAQDTRSALAGCDAAIVVCEADEKKAPALQLILKQLDELHLPRMLFVNKVDKSNSRPLDVLRWLQPASSVPLLLRQIPIWTDGKVSGFVDLALERAFVYREQAKSEVVTIPADLQESKKAQRFAMLEKLADHDDAMMEELLTDHDPPRDRVFQDLAQELGDGIIIPVLFGSAEHGNGIGRLLKALRHEAPNVTQTAARLGLNTKNGATALILKTLHTERGGKLSLARVLSKDLSDATTVYGAEGQDSRIGGIFKLFGQSQTRVSKAVAGDTVALARLENIATGQTISTTKGATPQLVNAEYLSGVFGKAISVERNDEVKLTTALHKLIEEDPSLSLQHSEVTHEMVLWGQGEIHLRVVLEKLQNKFGLQAVAKPRCIAYKETIRKSKQQRGRHKKQSGGHGQYGDVVVEIRPLSRGEGFVFSDTVVGGSVPKQYIPAVEQGIREWLTRGPLGFEVVDFAVNLTDGSYHDVDSSEIAFKMAARTAMVEAVPECQPLLLEPISAVDIHNPSEATSRVNQIVTSHRGQVLGFDSRPNWRGWDTVKAHMPESELGSLIVELRSATAGVGTFTFTFDHMAELNGRAADQVVAAYAKRSEL